jgi:hypothetical protein
VSVSRKATPREREEHNTAALDHAVDWLRRLAAERARRRSHGLQVLRLHWDDGFVRLVEAAEKQTLKPGGSARLFDGDDGEGDARD